MIECTKCAWVGETDQLVCSEADEKSGKLVREISFNLCPKCGGNDFDDYDDDEEDETDEKNTP